MGHQSIFLARPLADARLRMVTWTERAFDTVSHDPEALMRRLLQGAAPGAILLLHEGRGGDTAALSVLPDLVRELRSRGLEPVNLRELLATSPPPQTIAATSAVRPS